MNITIARRKLLSHIEGEYRLKYSKEEDVSKGDVIYVYGRRFIRKGKSKWNIEQIFKSDNKPTIGNIIEEDKGRQQLVLKMTIDKCSKRDNIVSNVSTFDRSEIDKEKEFIKNTVIQLWHIGWPTKYIVQNIGGNVCDLDESRFNSREIRPINVDDFKITTVNGQNKAMHLGHNRINQNYSFKLGVNWVSWHRMDSTKRLKILTHELCHCICPHHKEIFFKEHAKFISNICNSDSRKERVNELFKDEINWNELKIRVMSGVHSQPKDIDISGHPHRRSACESVVEKLENILNYEYKIGHTFYISPPTQALIPHWSYRAMYDDEVESKDDIRPDNIEMKEVKNLTFEDNYTDKELFEYLVSLKTDELSNLTKYVFSSEDIPIVTENKVEYNDILVSLYNRMILTNERKGFTDSVEIPVKIRT